MGDFFDNAWDSVSEFGSNVWSGASEYVGETFDVAVDAANQAARQAIRTAQEAGVDRQTLAANEPVKGQNTDGSTRLPTNQANAQAPMRQWIQGVDNTVVLAGGVSLLILTALVVSRAR
ncbi:hypothetical protein [Thalassotalea euphylliae]|uniref:Uncharacterized protein n=1 Tax=Thalassotalea euphylliae TaxID=1655234 RepID=A0A3E0U2B0_9GAMM|nr:hypothetical protein [Thalassotalea euphylliae]REL31076.1 hypothetical protein DXX94_10315 [Thalassotalea euphylliae]